MEYTRDILFQRHRLSQQQIDRWLGENRSVEFIQNKVKQLNAMKYFIAVTDRLRDNLISFICIKGPLLSYRIYNDPTVRFSHDIDLLIKPEQLDSTLNLLFEDNFQFTEGNSWPSEKIKQNLITKTLHHVSLYNKESKFCVEIHWTLMNGLPVSQKELANLISQNLTILNYAGREFTVLNREFELLYLMIHGARHGWARLKWLLDINDYPMEGINLDLLNSFIKQLHAERVTAQTNYFLNKYFGKQLPFHEAVHLPISLINGAQQCIDKIDIESLSIIDIFQDFRYRLNMFSQWSYKWEIFTNLLLSPGDIDDHYFSSEIMYYIYRPYSFIKRRVLHV
ncbi:nucleotidyltransferase family protein [Bacteroides ihuae]|uniref:nucleotidyltransferase family protein n=1 Tax=Bacteroides ihuae TaxID=1852362 RepID=UPI0008D91045|nr:nucleotidyltransferase family protein [Bacteroides ihuae]